MSCRAALRPASFTSHHGRRQYWTSCVKWAPAWTWGCSERAEGSDHGSYRSVAGAPFSGFSEDVCLWCCYSSNVLSSSLSPSFVQATCSPVLMGMLALFVLSVFSVANNFVIKSSLFSVFNYFFQISGKETLSIINVLHFIFF